MNDRYLVSIVMPCLNEEKTIGKCIDMAKLGLKKANLIGEIIISDNGSTDDSLKIIRRKKVKIVNAQIRGYGVAYLEGLKQAKGEYIIMGDSDGTYDFTRVGVFIGYLENGYDLVIGSRLKGKIIRGAMPFIHRFIGVPLLTLVMRIFYGTKIIDTHSGFRAITKKAYKKLNLKTKGMEFASEMIIKAVKRRLKIIEIPIVYYPRKGESKLNTFRDGWRHLRFMLLYSPTYLFLIPGIIITFLGLTVLMVLLPGPLFLFIHVWDIHAMVLASLMTILGVQIISLGLSAGGYSYVNEIGSLEGRLNSFLAEFKIEKGLLLGFLIALVGIVINLRILQIWLEHDLGPINEIRAAIFALTLIVVGVQLIFSSFFLGIILEVDNK